MSNIVFSNYSWNNNLWILPNIALFCQIYYSFLCFCFLKHFNRLTGVLVKAGSCFLCGGDSLGAVEHNFSPQYAWHFCINFLHFNWRLAGCQRASAHLAHCLRHWAGTSPYEWYICTHLSFVSMWTYCSFILFIWIMLLHLLKLAFTIFFTTPPCMLSVLLATYFPPSYLVHQCCVTQ